MNKMELSGDFLFGPVVKNLLCPVGMIADQGTKFPHATTTEAYTTQLESPCAATKRFHMMQRRLGVPQPRPTQPSQ